VFLFTADVGSKTSTSDLEGKGNEKRSRSGQTTGEEIADPKLLILRKEKKE
jgi:hypothetical protein